MPAGAFGSPRPSFASARRVRGSAFSLPLCCCLVLCRTPSTEVRQRCPQILFIQVLSPSSRTRNAESPKAGAKQHRREVAAPRSPLRRDSRGRERQVRPSRQLLQTCSGTAESAGQRPQGTQVDALRNESTASETSCHAQKKVTMPSGAARSAPWACSAARTALALFASRRSRAARVVRTTSVFRAWCRLPRFQSATQKYQYGKLLNLKLKTLSVNIIS